MKLKFLLALGLGLILTVHNSNAAEITVVSWGGAYSKSQIEAYHKPFIANTGHTVRSEDYNGGLAEIKSQVEANNVTWDVVDVSLSDAVRGCDEGLLEPIDWNILPDGADGTPAIKDFLPGTLHECAIANAVGGTIYAYDTTKFTDSPTTIGDFYDIVKYPGKRGMQKAVKVNLEMALAADGVPSDKIYDVLSTPEGVDRAFAKLDSIKDHVIWWEAGAQPPQLLADGEVIMTTAYNGRIFGAIVGENKPFKIVWDALVFNFDFWVIPKGSKNKEVALDFIAFSTMTEPLAAQASWISYGPARQSSVPLIGSYIKDENLLMAPHMPTAPENFATAIQVDFEFWADNNDELNERFNAWLAS